MPSHTHSHHRPPTVACLVLSYLSVAFVRHSLDIRCNCLDLPCLHHPRIRRLRTGSHVGAPLVGRQLLVSPTFRSRLPPLPSCAGLPTHTPSPCSLISSILRLPYPSSLTVYYSSSFILARLGRARGGDAARAQSHRSPRLVIASYRSHVARPPRLRAGRGLTNHLSYLDYISGVFVLPRGRQEKELKHLLAGVSGGTGPNPRGLVGER
ncbi:hypothetical protein BD414DRAFT_248474 [Trametes punicea]|nr:hypothetical protein BD414DRAFT_248474 [Trametes punicea]